MDSQKLIGQRLQQHQEVISLVQNDDSLKNTLSSIIETIVACFKTDNKVYFCGNGGSASDAQHLAAEFSGRFYLDRGSLPSKALHCNTSYLTAVANDYSYDLIYSRLVSGVGRKGDILVGLSTSGNSKNIVEAFKTAKGKEMLTIALIGEKKEDMEAFSGYIIHVPCSDTPRIQETHILLGHIICEMVESAIFGKK